MKRMDGFEPRGGVSQPSPEDVAFAKIADSNVFRAAPMMRTLLVYLWGHRSDSISEYAIAIEALGRRSDFDPRVDATVRVQISRLRAKLKEFYDVNGDSFPLRLSIPLGGHQLEFIHSPAVPGADSVHLETRPGHSRSFWFLASASLVLTALCVSLFVQNRSLRASAPLSTSPLPRFWQSFLNGDRPTAVVVPTPIHLSWPNQKLFVRERTLTDYSDWSKSPILLELAKRWGPPELTQGYVVVNHVLPAVKLVQYLERHGRSTHLLASPRLGIDSNRDWNTILMGGPRNTRRFQAFLSKQNFEIVAASPTLIRNLNPKSDEPEEYRESAASDEHITFPGIIGLLPRSPEGTGSLVLIARHPDALVSMLLSAEGLKLLDHQWKQHGQPAAWEMVVQAEMNGETVLNVRPVGFRSVP
jgi:hypothetical protein